MPWELMERHLVRVSILYIHIYICIEYIGSIVGIYGQSQSHRDRATAPINLRIIGRMHECASPRIFPTNCNANVYCMDICMGTYMGDNG